MEINSHIARFAIGDASGAGEVRRAAAMLAQHLQFNETDAGKISLAATEVAQNIFAHASSGEIFLRATGPHTIELIAIDSGPGMMDVAQCMRDGFSTAGTQGMGLGMLTRTATRFDIYSRSGQGTIVWMEFDDSGVAAGGRRSSLNYGVICVPHPGEAVAGDNWDVHSKDRYWRALVVDGLGHGLHAKEAADEAVRVFRQNVDQPNVEIMHRLHAALRKTRGAAAALVSFDPSRSEASLVGVGNISVSLLQEGKTHSMVSHSGTLGAEMRRVQEFSYACAEGALLVMHSDGLTTHWKLENYPGLLLRHPAVIAAVLYRDFRRGRDDVTVLCARRNTTVQ